MATPSCSKCPVCSGRLETAALGPLHDKHLVCAHCGVQVDVPDEFEVSRAVHLPTAHGSKRVEVSYRRRDLGGDVRPERVVGHTAFEGEVVLDGEGNLSLPPEVERLMVQAGIDAEMLRDLPADQEHVFTAHATETRSTSSGERPRGAVEPHARASLHRELLVLARWGVALATIIAAIVLLKVVL